MLGQAYLAATVASVSTAVGFNRFIASRPSLSNSIIGRLVPLIAVAAANCVNIPLMRQVKKKSKIDDRHRRSTHRQSGCVSIPFMRQMKSDDRHRQSTSPWWSPSQLTRRGFAMTPPLPSGVMPQL
jgi:hypothetical protein